MDFLSITASTLALHMDCFAVSISKGICLKKMQLKNINGSAFWWFSKADACDWILQVIVLLVEITTLRSLDCLYFI